MRTPKKASWPPYLPVDVRFEDLGDDRLAYLAAKPEIERRSQTTGFNLLAYIHASMVGRDVARDRAAEIRRTYAFGVDAAAQRLTPAERADLRASGRLPDWFFDVVEANRETTGR